MIRRANGFAGFDCRAEADCPEARGHWVILQLQWHGYVDPEAFDKDGQGALCFGLARILRQSAAGRAEHANGEKHVLDAQPGGRPASVMRALQRSFENRL